MVGVGIVEIGVGSGIDRERDVVVVENIVEIDGGDRGCGVQRRGKRGRWESRKRCKSCSRRVAGVVEGVESTHHHRHHHMSRMKCYVDARQHRHRIETRPRGSGAGLYRCGKGTRPWRIEVFVGMRIVVEVGRGIVVVDEGEVERGRG